MFGGRICLPGRRRRRRRSRDAEQGRLSTSTSLRYAGKGKQGERGSLDSRIFTQDKLWAGREGEIFFISGLCKKEEEEEGEEEEENADFFGYGVEGTYVCSTTYIQYNFCVTEENCPEET